MLAGELAEEVYLQEQVSEYEARIGALERKIGQLTMELDVMKKRALIRPSDQSARPSIISGPGACPSDEDGLRVRIEDILAEFPSYGYRRMDSRTLVPANVWWGEL